MKRIMATPFYSAPKGAKPFRNPFRKAVKQLRASGHRKQARALAGHARDAAREVHAAEVKIRKALHLYEFLEKDRDQLTRAAESVKVET